MMGHDTEQSEETRATIDALREQVGRLTASSCSGGRSPIDERGEEVVLGLICSLSAYLYASPERVIDRLTGYLWTPEEGEKLKRHNASRK